nr:MAG: hypothetical protein DIU54_07975 [Acidobacteriota bacterium]
MHQSAVLPRIHNVHPGSQDSHRPSAPFEGPFVGGRIDPHGQTADDNETCGREVARERSCQQQARGGRPA